MSSNNAFTWSMIKLLSGFLGVLAVVIVGFFSSFTACFAYPSSPLICNGLVALPLLYAGIVGIVFSLTGLKRLRGMNKLSEVTETSMATPRGLLTRLKRPLGKWLYVLGVGLPLAVAIGSLQFTFYWGLQYGGKGFTMRLFNFDYWVLLAFTAAMITLACLGVRLCPAIRESIVRYTALGVTLSAIIEGWPALQGILLFL